MITSIVLEILYVDILDTGSFNETGTVNAWGLSGIWFSLAAIQINLLSQCKIGSFSSINYKRSSKSSNFRIRNAPNPGFIVGQLHKKLGNPAAKTSKDLIHCSCIRASCFMLVLRSWKAAKTSKRFDPSFFFREFMFQTCIAVIKKCWTTVVKTTKKIWYIILFFGNSCFKQVLR